MTIKDIPHVGDLSSAMNKLLQPDGSYRRNKRTTSVGETWQLQSPRHTAAAFILRTLTGDYNHLEDSRTILYVLSKMNCEDDYFTKAVISKCFLKYLKLKNDDIPMRDTLYDIWSSFYEGAMQVEDIRFLWYSASSHAGEMAAEQWYTIAFLLPLIELFQDRERKRNSELISIICEFIRKTYSERNSESGLLPLGYKKKDNGIIMPVGSSISASALAAYIANALIVIDGSVGDSLDDIRVALLTTLAETDIAKFSLDFSSQKSLQGYLDYVAILICFNQIGVGVSSDMIPKTMNAGECAIIDEHFNALEIRVDDEGLYI